ncbi:citrate/2-methylcitrate synthase [Sediminispirochaeta bajacaliforniensis]|uniref:citrate/2-methylcitrate synthase n=1 Tax=Sediminispirochaeta bajacaliforniensis TaxID=148 RepID=UPI00037A62A8|nr:citrate/2-methylcitrate synthase [Sediminispirochaeta bajacaliforniensis]
MSECEYKCGIPDITEIGDEGIRYRGTRMDDLIGPFGFARSLGLLITGKRPTEIQARMIDALLVSAADHGEKAPSACITTSAASARASLGASVAAGLLAIGDVHGGAARQCAAMLLEAEKEKDLRKLLRRRLESGKRIPGFGHRIYREKDPRATLLLQLAAELGLAGRCCGLLQETERLLPELIGKTLVINIDGAHGAILADLGWEPSMCEALFIIARSAGLCAHALADFSSRRPLQFISELQGGR